MTEYPILERHSNIFIFLQFWFKLKLLPKLWGWVEIFKKRIFLRNAIKKLGQRNKCEKLASIRIKKSLTKLKKYISLKYKCAVIILHYYVYCHLRSYRYKKSFSE